MYKWMTAFFSYREPAPENVPPATPFLNNPPSQPASDHQNWRSHLMVLPVLSVTHKAIENLCNREVCFVNNMRYARRASIIKNHFESISNTFNKIVKNIITDFTFLWPIFLFEINIYSDCSRFFQMF